METTISSISFCLARACSQSCGFLLVFCFLAIISWLWTDKVTLEESLSFSFTTVSEQALASLRVFYFTSIQNDKHGLRNDLIRVRSICIFSCVSLNE